MAFLDLCMSVTTVLCCRMTPLQKASIIELVHVGLKERSKQGGGAPVTAAVGDGGNDVSMLLQANVGIGIYGKEGREAVRAADYAIPQFQHLRRLLLVHGQWSYHRISMTMVMFYHKCVTFVTTQIALNFYSGISANSWFTSFHYTLYNLTFTALTNLLFGIFEKHLTDKQLLQHPRLYRLTIQHANLRAWYVILWVLDGVWQGLVIFYSVYFFLAGNEDYASAIFLTLDASPRNQFDFTLCGCACLVYVIISVNIRAMLHTRDFNVAVAIGLVITAVGNLILLMILQLFVKPWDGEFYSYIKLAQSPTFWLALPVTLLMAGLPGLIWRIYSDHWWKEQMQRASKNRVAPCVGIDHLIDTT
ncbi:hypothetical protein EG68_11770 [Paragonimus skrjabini miyazakii]|uniref:P-type ATPase C-terminal domain-containing protein n=1 Tax=Paragonimus skrjabini miyazakii TaxID=59628 RepID=A0A8S9YPQ0_9TREM|nr:hypothetical protein EG68_11770 [Paragonimus skrjabini miyazakii]